MENLTLTKTEEDEMWAQVKRDFPEDPALQFVHYARKRIEKLAQLANMTFLEYIAYIDRNR